MRSNSKQNIILNASKLLKFTFNYPMHIETGYYGPKQYSFKMDNQFMDHMHSYPLPFYHPSIL